ncbi:MAG TPA: hypothetical protein VFW25_13505 [Silvibacterium sp.]|nr:hypothetical protein [Silvibacterium sp.]
MAKISIQAVNVVGEWEVPPLIYMRLRETNGLDISHGAGGR